MAEVEPIEGLGGGGWEMLGCGPDVMHSTANNAGSRKRHSGTRRIARSPEFIRDAIPKIPVPRASDVPLGRMSDTVKMR